MPPYFHYAIISRCFADADYFDDAFSSYLLSPSFSPRFSILLIAAIFAAMPMLSLRHFLRFSLFSISPFARLCLFFAFFFR